MFTSAIRGLAMWLVKFSFVSCLASHLCWSLSPFSHRSISHKAQYGGAGQGARSGAFDTALGGYGYYGPNSRPNGPNGPNAGPNGPNGAYGVYGAYGPYGLFGPYGNPSNGLSGSEPLGPFGYLYASLGYGTSSTNSFWGHDLQLSWIAFAVSQVFSFTCCRSSRNVLKHGMLRLGNNPKSCGSMGQFNDPYADCKPWVSNPGMLQTSGGYYMIGTWQPESWDVLAGHVLTSSLLFFLSVFKRFSLKDWDDWAPLQYSFTDLGSNWLFCLFPLANYSYQVDL